MANVRIINWLASFAGGLRLPSGAGAGKIAVSDASGNVEWKTLLYVERAAYIVDGAVAVKAWEPFFVEKASSDVQVQLVRARYKIASGTSATLSIKRNGSAASGFTGLEAKPTAAVTEPTAITVAEGDELLPEVTAVSGSPAGLTFQFVLLHTV